MKKEILKTNFSIKFKEKETKEIYSLMNKIDDKFSNLYLPPEIIPVPDEIDSSVPRLSLKSKNGYSDIFFSKLSIDFFTSFDNRLSEAERIKYCKERTKLIQELISENEHDFEIAYCGHSFISSIDNIDNFEVIVQSLDNRLALDVGNTAVHDEEIYDYGKRKTFLKNDKYFINIEVQSKKSVEIIPNNIQSGLLNVFDNELDNPYSFELIIDCNNRYNYMKKNNTITSEQLNSEIDTILDLTINKYEQFDLTNF